jgi:hypothetical protein
MKMLLVALQLSLTPQVPVPDAESAVSTPPAENKKVIVFDFEDDGPIDLGPMSSEWGCQLTPSRLIRIREDFDDKVMQSVEEM